MGCYRKSFVLPDDWDNKDIHIIFEGVCSLYRIWINGNEIGFSQGSHLLSEFDITDFLHKGENTAAVMVYQMSWASYFEDQDMWRLNGIFRDVYLAAREPEGILDAVIQTEVDDNYNRWKYKAVIKGKNRGNSVELLFCDGDNIIYRDEKNLSESTEFSADIAAPKLWSAEEPYLYSTFIVLKKGTHISEVYKINTGFRQLEVKDSAFLVNGRAVKLKGVNRHDTHPDKGYAVSYEDMLNDVILMKQHNINTVRTAHYPNDSMFLDLCDRYGLYVVDETDIETNGFDRIDNPALLADDEEWRHVYIERMERMVMRDRNHPSVIMWSLGNESGSGKNHAAMAEWTRRLDSSRPVHYEGAGTEAYVDVVSRMYATYEECIKYGEDTSDKRPFFLCEYAHAMGNGPGGVQEYWDIIEKYDRNIGGCIWEWADHGMRDNADSTDFKYGGDYGDWPNDGNFCCDGLCTPERIPHSGLKHYKEIIAPIAVEAVDINKGRINVINKHFHISLNGIKLFWRVLANGIEENRGEVLDMNALSGEKTSLTLPYSASDDGREYILDLSFRLKNDALWAAADFEISHKQLTICKGKSMSSVKESSESVYAKQNDFMIEIFGADFKYSFDKLDGCFTQLEYKGHKLLTEGKGPRLNIYWAIMDNDYDFGNGFIKDWNDAEIKHLQHYPRSAVLVRADGAFAEIKSTAWLASKYLSPLFYITYTYSIYGDGSIRIDTDARAGAYKNNKYLPQIPKIGLQLELFRGFEHVEWYGRGPMDNYADKLAGSHIERYEMPVEALFENHIRPQENGNRSDVRWVSIASDDGIGIFVTGDRPFNFSARHYTDKNLDEAEHTDELIKTEGTVLNIDFKVAGVGSGSCGPSTLEKYRVKHEDTSFAYVFSPYDRTELLPGKIYEER